MGFLRVSGIIVGTIVLLIGIVFVAARLSDGPFGLIAGGELTSGELVTGPDPTGVSCATLQLSSFSS